MEKWNELDTSAKLGAIGAVLVLVGSLLPWYSFAGFGVSGWGAGLPAVLGIVVTLAAAVVLLAEPLFGAKPTIGSLHPAQTALIGAVVGTALVLLRFLTATSFVSIGLFLSLAAAGLVTYAAFATVKAAGLPVPLLGGSGSQEET